MSAKVSIADINGRQPTPGVAPRGGVSPKVHLSLGDSHETRLQRQSLSRAAQLAGYRPGVSAESAGKRLTALAPES